MIKTIIDKIKQATIGITSFDIGVKLLMNVTGKDLYPLTFMDITNMPISVDTDSKPLIFDYKVTLYVVIQRLLNTSLEELEQLDAMSILCTQILNNLKNELLSNVSMITVSGVIDSAFADGCNGIRLEFNIKLYDKC